MSEIICDRKCYCCPYDTECEVTKPKLTGNITIDTLQLIKAAIEWEHPLDYIIAIDEAIQAIQKLTDIVEALKKECTNCKDYSANWDCSYGRCNEQTLKRIQQIVKGEQNNEN